MISFEDNIGYIKNVPELMLEIEDSLKKVIENNSIVLGKIQQVDDAAQEVSAAFFINKKLNK